MSQVRPDAVLKVGGSLCRVPGRVRRLMATLGTLAPPRTIVVVPGGGLFAEQVRRADRRFALDASSSHWMAILGMDQSAYLLRHLASGAVLVRDPRDIRTGGLNVLAPSAWLLRANPLPHSWGVTSDSIAAWVARALRARRLVLLKSVDGAPGRPGSAGRPAPSQIRRQATIRQLGGIVDEHFGLALTAGVSCWIVSGARPERLASLFETGSTYGTEIIRRVRAPDPRRRGRGDIGRVPRRGRG